MKIKKDDTVIIISGKDRGRKGKVLESFPKKDKVSVEGINLVKKHRRPKNEREKGQVVELVKPIDVSNVKLICPKCGKSTRVAYKVVGKKKYRICNKCKQEL